MAFVALEPGDDIGPAIDSTAAVIVLDAARANPSVADYDDALRAVAESARASSAPVIALTLLPAIREAREAFIQRAEELEAKLRASAIDLTVMRCALVVGTIDREGPLDDALIAHGALLPVPGDGEQLVRPLNIDELAARVGDAATSEGQTDYVRLEAETAVTLDALLRDVNGHRFLPIRGHLFSALIAMFSPRWWPRISPPSEVLC